MLQDFIPHMSEAERSLLGKHIPAGGCCLEFGSGGSTQFFFEQGVKKLYSVDSDRDWLEKLGTSPVVRTYNKHGRWFPLYADIGPVQSWGNPLSLSLTPVWLNYHQHCWDLIEAGQLDLVLVDGRFRVACILQSLLRCDLSRFLIVVHDFWSRPGYHVVLDFLETLDRADTLGVFRPGRNIDWRRLGILLQKFQFVFE